MKSKGYTLAEVLITLAVIGVIAAVVAPLINKYRPDSTKIMYLKTYDAVTESIKFLANSDKIYPLTMEMGDGQVLAFTDYPFYNPFTAKVDGIEMSGNTKLCSALGYVLSPTRIATCGDTYVAQDKVETDWTPSFNARNGAEFFVTTINDLENEKYQTDIYFDVNGAEKGNNCLYDGDNCKEPDRFKLIVDARGKVYPADPVGNAYIANRHAIRKIKTDEMGNLILAWKDINDKIEGKINKFKDFSIPYVEIVPSGTGDTETIEEENKDDVQPEPNDSTPIEEENKDDVQPEPNDSTPVEEENKDDVQPEPNDSTPVEEVDAIPVDSMGLGGGGGCVKTQLEDIPDNTINRIDPEGSIHYSHIEKKYNLNVCSR